MKPPRSAIDQIEFMRNLLAFLLVGAFIAIAAVLFAFAIPEQNKDILTYMVGQLSGMALTALGFYFVNKVGQDALDAARTDNTGKMAEAVTTALKGAVDPSGQAEQAAQQVADAATSEADAIKGDAR
ncbi:MAG: hypothetical protein V4696_10295 [Pseudomonadota bacterium]